MEGLKNQTKNSNGNLQNQTQSPTKKRRKPLGASKRKNKSQNALVSTVQLFETFLILNQTEAVHPRCLETVQERHPNLAVFYAIPLIQQTSLPQ